MSPQLSVELTSSWAVLLPRPRWSFCTALVRPRHCEPDHCDGQRFISATSASTRSPTRTKRRHTTDPQCGRLHRWAASDFSALAIEKPE
jgi:hypothetical protein